MVEGLTIRSNDKCRSASGRMPTLLFDQMAALRQKRTHPSTGPLVSKKSDKAPIDNIFDGGHIIALKAEGRGAGS